MSADRARGTRLRVLHVIQNLNYGGMERVLTDTVSRIDRERFDPHVLVLQYPGRFSRELEGVATLHTAVALPRWSLLWPKRLAAQIREIGPDVVHTHSGVWYKASAAARWAGVRRIVHTEHGRRWPEPLQDRIIDRVAAGRTDAIVTVSDTLVERLARLTRDRGRRIHVIPNGICTDRFRPRQGGKELRSGLGISAAGFLIGSVGRLEPVKGYDVMIRALAILHRSGFPETAVALIGDGSERSRLDALARSEGVADRVHFLGWRDDVAELYPEFDLFTLSSHSEGTSISLLEAMSCGVCPVVTDVGGNARVVGDSLSHRLVPPADPGTLAAGWSGALAAASARERDAAAARSRVLDAFGIERMAGAYARLYLGEAPADG